MQSTIKLEAGIGRRNTPDFAWPPLVLAIGLWVGFIAVIVQALEGGLPMALAAAINTVIIYAIYTPLHDSIHSSIFPRRRELRWVHTAVGMACAAPLWMFYHHHRRSHFLHHAKANTPEDPDLYAMGSFARVFFVKIPWTLVNYFNPIQLYRECLRFRLSDRERRITMALFAVYAMIATAIIAAGFGYQLLLLWVVPWFVGNLLMLTAFGWAPHHDHSETGRYRDTRISLFPGADLLYLYQNLHLVHHMLPSIPFYHYRAAFNELRPLLERNGARIEGFWPTSPSLRSSRAGPAPIGGV
jgi:beta-carotene hydroxylase